MLSVVPDHDELHDDLGYLFGRLARRMAAVEAPALERHGLSMWGYVVLSSVVTEPERPQVAVAQGVGLDRTSMVSVLDELERAGHVRRQPHPTDRRARLIEATSKGIKTLVAVRREIRTVEDQVLAALPPDQRAALRPALRALLAAPEGRGPGVPG
jgi:DNA-binding MarR family transcriptional regulator